MIPDAIRDEKIVGFVVLAPDAMASLTDVERHCREKLADCKALGDLRRYRRTSSATNGDVCVAAFPLGVAPFASGRDSPLPGGRGRRHTDQYLSREPRPKTGYVALSSTGRLFQVPRAHAGRQLAFPR